MVNWANRFLSNGLFNWLPLFYLKKAQKFKKDFSQTWKVKEKFPLSRTGGRPRRGFTRCVGYRIRDFLLFLGIQTLDTPLERKIMLSLWVLLL